MTSYISWCKKRIFVIINAVYMLGGLLILPLYRHQLNPDAVAYFSITKHYAAGDLHQAINGYWGPLWSWLLVPFSWLHVDLQIASKLLALFIGLATLLVTKQLLKQWGIRTRLVVVVLITLIPLLWYWALPSPAGPDILLPLIIEVYILAIYRSKLPNVKHLFLIALVAATGYFAKAYFLPFFVVQLFVYLTYFVWTKQLAAKAALKSYVICGAIFGLLILPWVTALSLKYNKPTISTSSAYNFKLLNPQIPGHPMKYAGLLPPHSKVALSAWEDPSYLPMQTWSPLSSRDNLSYYQQVVLGNIRVSGEILLVFSVFSLSVLTSLGVWLLAKRRQLSQQQAGVLLLSASFVYTLGYTVVVIEERYLWPVFVMVLLTAALLLQYALPSFKSWVSKAVILLGMASVMIVPSWRLFKLSSPNSKEWHQAQTLKPLFNGNEHIASDSFDSIRHCYYLNAICYGQLNLAQPTGMLEQQLKDDAITDILFLQRPPANKDFLSDYKKVPLKDTNLTLYRKLDN